MQIALSFTGLERLEEGQRGIESFFGSKPPVSANSVGNDNVKRARSESPVTPLLSSSTSVTPASADTPLGPSPKKPRLPTLHTGKRKSGLDLFLVKNGESSRQSGTSPSPVPTLPAVPIEIIDDDEPPSPTPMPTLPERFVELPEESQTSWSCPRCQAVFAAPAQMEAPGAKVFVQAQKQEHEDYHYALDLQDGDRPSSSARPPPAVIGGGKGKVKKKKAEGIKAFFAPKPSK